MATMYVDMKSGEDAAASFTGSHAGVGVDLDTGKAYFNPDGTRRQVAYNEARALTAAATLTAADNGRDIFFGSTTEFAIALPAPVAGFRLRAFCTAAPSGASYTITAPTAVIVGQVYTLDVDSGTNPDFETTGATTITFVDGKAVKGDSVDITSDGTNYYVRAFCSVFDAITISGS